MFTSIEDLPAGNDQAEGHDQAMYAPGNIHQGRELSSLDNDCTYKNGMHQSATEQAGSPQSAVLALAQQA